MSSHRRDAEGSNSIGESHSRSTQDVVSAELRESSRDCISSEATLEAQHLPASTSTQTSRVVIPLEIIISEEAQKGEVREASPPRKSPSPTPSAPGGGSGHSGSSQEVACRICQDTDPPLFVWCNCKGTIGMAHKECLEEWIARSGATRCELCGFTYHTQRVPRFASRWRSLRPWLTSNVMEQTALVADSLGALLCLSVGAGTAIVCGLGVRTLHDPRASSANADTLFLQLMCCVASMVALVWFALAVRFHVQVWLRWWHQQFDVRVVPRSDESLYMSGWTSTGQDMGLKGYSIPTAEQRAPPARTSANPTPRSPMARMSPWRWLRQRSALQAAARDSVHEWRPPRRGGPACTRGARAPAPPTPTNRAYTTMGRNRYYTMVDPFNDWTQGGLQFPMLSVPVTYPNTAETTFWRNQRSVVTTAPTAGIHTYRVPPTASPESPSPSPPPPVVSSPDFSVGFATDATAATERLISVHTSSDFDVTNLDSVVSLQ